MPIRRFQVATTKISDVWAESKCMVCGKRISKHEPRCVVMLAELGIGPGHREYRSAKEYGDDEDVGLLGNSSFAAAICCPCSGESKTIEIANPWFALREA